jgi:uncharacterized tellurite resistance protein B-like protein
MSLLRFLGLEDDKGAAGVAETDTVRRIAGALDQMEPERARYVSGFAYVLSRVARADLNISEVESREMERIVAGHGGLPEAQAVLVVQIAKTQQKLFGSTEDFLVTREFNKTATREQKLELLDCLFAVAAADGVVSGAEDDAIRQVAREFTLEHPDFIAVRSRYRDFLAVLKKPAE